MLAADNTQPRKFPRCTIAGVAVLWASMVITRARSWGNSHSQNRIFPLFSPRWAHICFQCYAISISPSTPTPTPTCKRIARVAFLNPVSHMTPFQTALCGQTGLYMCLAGSWRMKEKWIVSPSEGGGEGGKEAESKGSLMEQSFMSSWKRELTGTLEPMWDCSLYQEANTLRVPLQDGSWSYTDWFFFLKWNIC